MKHVLFAFVLLVCAPTWADGLYLTDSEGIAVRSGSGDCVRCDGGSPAPECMPAVIETPSVMLDHDQQATHDMADIVQSLGAPQPSPVSGIVMQAPSGMDGYDAGYDRGNQDGFVVGYDAGRHSVKPVARLVHDTPACPTPVPVAPSIVTSEVRPAPHECEQVVTSMALFVICLMVLIVGILGGRLTVKRD